MTTTKDVQPSSKQKNAKSDTCKPEEGKAFYCKICNIDCMMASIFEAHCQGKKHKLRAMTDGDDPKKGQKNKELAGDDAKEGQKIKPQGEGDPKKSQKPEEPLGSDPKKGRKSKPEGGDPKKDQQLEEPVGNDPKKGRKSKPEGNDPKKGRKSKPEGNDPKKGRKSKPEGGDSKKDQQLEDPVGSDPKKGRQSKPEGGDPKKDQQLEEPVGSDKKKKRKGKPEGGDPKKDQQLEVPVDDVPKNGQTVGELEGHSQVSDFRIHARFLKIYAYLSNREPLIGLQHIIENTVPDSTDPRFTCDLCEYCSDLGPLIEHLNSFEHRKAYIAKAYPYLLKVPPAQSEDRVAFLKRMALDVERDEGVKMYRSDILQDDAIHFMKTFEISSDEEALSVMTLTQNLSETLKTYCLQKSNAEKAENAANIPGKVNSLNLHLADTFGRGDSQMPLDPQNSNWNRESAQSKKSVALNQEATFHNQLSQPLSHTAEIENYSSHVVQNQNIQPKASLPINASQFTFALNKSDDSMSYKPTENQSNVYGRISNNSELHSFASSVPRGPGGFPSGSPAYVRDQDHGSRLQAISRRFSDNVSSSYTSGGSNTRLLQDTLDHPQRSNNLGFPKYLQTNSVAPSHADTFPTSVARDMYRGLPRTIGDGGRRERDAFYMNDFPKLASLDPVNRSSEMYSAGIGNRMLPGKSFAGTPVYASDLPRSSVANMPALGPTSVLATDILAIIKGKDIKSASKVLNDLAPTHPALKKVNIANLLNLLIQTGTIH